MTMKLIALGFGALLATAKMAVADERISLIIGHPEAAWQAHCIVNLSDEGEMTTVLQLSRDSMPAAVVPLQGMAFLPDRFKVLRAAMMAGTWPQSVAEDEVWEAPFVSVVYSQRDGSDVTLERRVFQNDLVVDSLVQDLFAPLYDGGCLAPPPP